MSWVAPIFVLFALLSACSPQSVDSYSTGTNEEEIITLLNKREFDRAIWLIESKHGRNPEDPRLTLLLGEAYLGKADFEPLAFAARVSGPQNFSSPEAQTLFPFCGEARFTARDTINPRCLLKRVYLQAPNADQADFARARTLLRKAQPIPAQTSEQLNAIIGMVETASLVKRLGNIYLRLKQISASLPSISNQEKIQLRSQVELALREANEALERARYTNEKISRLLTGNRETQWFEQAQNSMRFAEKLGLAGTLDLLRERLLSPNDEVRYGDLLDRLKESFEAEESASTSP